MFMLRIRNTCLEKPIKDGKWFVTTKEDLIYHGWGTANVKQIVESAGGEIEYTCERNWFEVNILIQERVDEMKEETLDKVLFELEQVESIEKDKEIEKFITYSAGGFITMICC